MSRSVRAFVALPLLALLGLLAGCGEGKEASEIEKKGQEVGKWLGEKGSEGVEAIQRQTAELSEAAQAQIAAMVDPYRDDARALLNRAGGGAQSAIDSLATKPGEKAAVERQALLFAARHLPVIRAVTRYSEARVSYAAALAKPEGPEKKMALDAARRQCLIACLEAGLDVTTIGTTGLVDQAAHHATHVLKALQIAQLASTKTNQSWIRPLDEFLDAGLAIPSVAVTMDTMLSTDLSRLGDVAVN